MVLLHQRQQAPSLVHLADNLSELEVVPNPDQRDVAEWSEESEEDNSDSDEDESCAWLYERW